MSKRKILKRGKKKPIQKTPIRNGHMVGPPGGAGITAIDGSFVKGLKQKRGTQHTPEPNIKITQKLTQVKKASPNQTAKQNVQKLVPKTKISTVTKLKSSTATITPPKTSFSTAKQKTLTTRKGIQMLQKQIAKTSHRKTTPSRTIKRSGPKR